MTDLKLGIDNGNYNTKSSDHMLYASGFTKQENEFIVNNMSLFYNGSYYAIGDRRMSLQQEKAKEEDTFILTLPALANCMKLNGVNEANFSLGVGLPMDIYGAQKDAFRKYFLRSRFAFSFEGENYAASISEVKVFPQGHAAMCKHFSKFRNIQSVSIADIGGYTVDCLTVQNNVPLKSSCMSLRYGTIKLFNSIRSHLQQQNIILSDSLIESAVQGNVQHARADYIRSVVKEEIDRYIKSLFNQLREYGLDLGLPIAFSGGGAELLGQRLAKPEINLVAVLDSFANADGYKVLMG